MRIIISIVVSAVIIGGVFGYIAGNRFADEYPYSLAQEKEALAQKAANAQTDDTNDPSEEPLDYDRSKPYPVVAIDEETHDFGVFEKEQKGQYTFVVRNEGNANLILKMLNKSCSCTSVDFLRTTVPPGRDTRVTMHWEPNNAGGSYQQGVEIGTNDPTRPRFQLFIKGVYSAPVIATPNPIQLNAYTSDMATNQARIYYFGKDDVNIKEIVCDDTEHFSAAFVKSELTEENLKNNLLKSARAVYDITVTMKPGMPIGYFKHNLIVRSDSELSPEFTLPISGQVLGNLTISGLGYNKTTGVLNLGTAYHGTAVQRVVMILCNTSGETVPEFKVTSKSPEWLNVKLGQVIPGGENRSLLQVTVEIPADAGLGTSEMNDEDNAAAFVIESNLPEVSTIRIPVQYDVREKAAE